MSTLQVRLHVLTILTILYCSPGQSAKEQNDAVVFESTSADHINNKPQKLTQNKETGFDVPFDGEHFDKQDDNTQSWLGRPVTPGYDSGFDGSRFAGSDSHGFQPSYGHASDSDFHGTGPGFGFGQAGSRPGLSHSDNIPAYGHSVDSAFDGTRPGFWGSGSTNVYPNFASGRPGYGQTVTSDFDSKFDGTRPGFASSGNYPAFASSKPPSSQGVAGGYDSGFDGTGLAFAKGYDTAQPWFVQRYPRQVNNGRRYRPGFDSGFDGTRPGFAQNNRPSFDAGFDGSRFQNRPSFDGGFDGSRFQNRPSFDGGFDGSKFVSRNPRELELSKESSKLNTRVRRGVDSTNSLVESEGINQSIDGDGHSQRIFWPQFANGNNLPYPSYWNYQPTWGNPSYGGYDNFGPYGPGGFSQNGGMRPGTYWQI